MLELTLAPYPTGRGPIFSVQVWDTIQADTYPFVEMVRFGYRLSMDGKLVVEGEDYICSPNDPVRVLDGIISYFMDEGAMRQQANDVALRATTIEERDQYLRLLAYLPHCEALHGEAVTALCDMELRR